jgi:hypothetical protein
MTTDQPKSHLAAHYYNGPYWLDIMKNGGDWRYIIRAAKPYPQSPGVWIAEVNSGLHGAEGIANEIIARLNATQPKE